MLVMACSDDRHGMAGYGLGLVRLGRQAGVARSTRWVLGVCGEAPPTGSPQKKFYFSLHMFFDIGYSGHIAYWREDD